MRAKSVPILQNMSINLAIIFTNIYMSQLLRWPGAARSARAPRGGCAQSIDDEAVATLQPFPCWNCLVQARPMEPRPLETTHQELEALAARKLRAELSLPFSIIKGVSAHKCWRKLLCLLAGSVWVCGASGQLSLNHNTGLTESSQGRLP